MKALAREFELAHEGLTLSGEPYALLHVPDVLRLERLCFPNPWSEALLRQEAQPRDYVWNRVVRVDGKVVGFFFNWVVLDEVHLLNLAIHPDLHGRGIGGRILDFLLAETAGAGYRQMSLEVRASNAPAIGLYRSRRFATVSRRRGYYTDNGEDALIMIRDLQAEADGDGAAGDA